MGLAYLLEPSFQIVDKSGNPLSNGFIEVYISGTSTKYYCYSDFNGSLHPFRIPLDAIGSNIILASSESIYDVFIYNSFGTMVMSRHRVAPSTSTITSGNSYIIVEGTDGQVVVQSSGSTDITYKVGLDDAIINELSDIHTDISSTSAYLDDKINTEISNRTTADQYIQEQINNLDIHNISIEQNGSGNAYTSFTKNGDTYTFNKEATYLPSANAPVVIAGENVEVSSANINGQMQYTIKANPAGNVTNLISTDETIAISATSVGNDVTYDLSIGSLSGKANYALCSVNDYPLTANHFGGVVFDNYTTKGITWSTVDNRLEIPSSIKLLDVNVECELLLSNINNVSYGNLELGIYQDWGLLEEKKFEIDLSKERHFVNFTTKMLDVENLQFTIKSPANATANIRVGVNDESNAIGNGGSTYYAGLNIEISDNVISGRDWTPELNTKLDTSAYTPYTAGAGIAITDSEISVNAGKGLGFDNNNKLEVKVGDGLTYDSENKVITIDSDVSDVVASVNKLKKDLDTQITSNFDMPNIAQVYDFADPAVSTLANGACMLCQSFTIPINHEIRTVSEDVDEPTLLGIYAQQAFGHKIMLALYEYTYAKSGEEHGSSTYVGDTGPVDVLLGVNEYPLKNRNPSITELRCDKVYYATLYLPNAARVNGLLLAGAPNYGTQSVPAEPRLSCAVENITLNSQELDMNDPTATLNHYQTYTVDDVTYYNYYIGPWNSGYNERWSAPRFYIQIRNGEYNEHVIPTAPFVDLGNVLPTAADQVSDLPGFTPSTSNSSFRDVTPSSDVTITAFEWIDNMQNVAGWAAGNCVYDSGFATNLSNNNNTASDLGSVGTVDGQTMYAHRITFNTPLTLTANTTYRFLCECFESSSSYIFGWSTPTNVVHCGNNGWYVDTQNLTRYDNFIGKYNKLTDSNNNSYVI